MAADSDGQRFGEFAYAVVQPSRDFALIRLDPGVKASPEMCHFGAPRGLYSTDTDTAVVLRYYGNGRATRRRGARPHRGGTGHARPGSHPCRRSWLCRATRAPA